MLEAMRAGLPVVATDVGGVGEAVVHEETGFRVPRGDEGALRERLRVILENPSLRREMGARGRKRYEAFFTLERMLRGVWEAYQEVLGA
ncbi:hypothetical protein GCM10007092_12780 [Thermus composti]|nr:hypothetical protein GCM10007092_12780 [Thermus composti]